MNEYWLRFEKITASIETVLNDAQKTPETQQSVAKLKQSVAPCFKEIKQSATRLQSLIQVCFDDLKHTQDVWDSKQRITEMPTYEIWEQIGELSGRSIRIRRLGRQYRSEVVQQVKDDWYQREAILTQKYFYDNKRQFKSVLNIFEKDKFIFSLQRELQSQIQTLKRILIEKTKLISQEFEVQVPFIKSCIGQLDKQQEKETTAKFNSMTSTIASLVERAFIQRLDNLSINVNVLVDVLNNTADTLAKQSVLGLAWEQFDKCSKEIYRKLETIITTILDELVKLAEQAVEQGLTFYNAFLERQVRYRQETIEQREAEKAWIEKQYQELTQVQNGIDAILFG